MPPCLVAQIICLMSHHLLFTQPGTSRSLNICNPHPFSIHNSCRSLLKVARIPFLPTVSAHLHLLHRIRCKYKSNLAFPSVTTACSLFIFCIPILPCSLIADAATTLPPLPFLQLPSEPSHPHPPILLLGETAVPGPLVLASAPAGPWKHTPLLLLHAHSLLLLQLSPSCFINSCSCSIGSSSCVWI